ncbi:hypothetical protein SDC9_210543 [bioreactor metagenome]|uniref:Uncharacterized protein n=1 Tax=bioreactor metagenome TaxID=1076179 RepID=A0A645JI55_9ZZZZ
MLHLAEVGVLEDVEDLPDDHAARAGDGRRINAVSAVGGEAGLDNGHVVLHRQDILHREISAVSLHHVDDLLSNLPAVEDADALLLDALEGADQVLVMEDVAHGGRELVLI